MNSNPAATGTASDAADTDAAAPATEAGEGIGETGINYSCLSYRIYLTILISLREHLFSFETIIFLRISNRY